MVPQWFPCAATEAWMTNLQDSKHSQSLVPPSRNLRPARYEGNTQYSVRIIAYRDPETGRARTVVCERVTRKRSLQWTTRQPQTAIHARIHTHFVERAACN